MRILETLETKFNLKFTTCLVNLLSPRHIPGFETGLEIVSLRRYPDVSFTEGTRATDQHKNPYRRTQRRPNSIDNVFMQVLY